MCQLILPVKDQCSNVFALEVVRNELMEPVNALYLIRIGSGERAVVTVFKVDPKLFFYHFPTSFVD